MKKVLVGVLMAAMAVSLVGFGAKPADAADVKTVEAGKLHMATNAAFPPYEMTTDDGGYEGIDVEIATEIAKKLGLELVVDDMDFSSVITVVQTGKSDIAMAGLTVTDERKKNVDFTDSYATGIQSIIVPEGSDIATADDLADHMIGTQEGTTGFFYCTDDFGEEFVLSYPNGATAVQNLLAGKVDAVVIDNAPAQAFVEANDGLVLLDTEYVTEDYAIGVSKDNPDLCAAVNGALKDLIKDGTVAKIVEKYIPVE
ncbi:MAG: amino acid ABC transporter substrate-binding protein [Eubacterium sp.]|nr:amino acid ABC transporter substrate-binding protein [Eubacterium sp.]